MTKLSRPAPAPLPFRLPSISNQWRENLVICACLGLFLIYGAFRQRYIWGVDSYGYYQLGKLFSEGRLHLVTLLPGFDQSALVPYGFSLNSDQLILPNYPPGFPLLIAIGHLVQAPMWVTPFLGVVSCLVLFALLRDRVRPATAWLFTLAWAFMPLTVYGSTMLMSDLVAATVLMGGLLAFRRDHLFLAAWIFGLSFAVRPTNVLFLAPFALLLRPDRRTLRLGLHLVVPCLLYACYNYHLYGAPWRTGYGNIADNMVGSIFPSHFAFFLTTTVAVLSPLLVGLAVFGLAPWNREKIFLLLWPATFIVFYSFWLGGGIDRWWWARFILPGYAALFLLAAGGFESVGHWLDRRLPGRGALAARAVLFLAVLALPFHYVRFGLMQNDLWQRNTGAVNHEVVMRVREFAPPGSLVGSVELASTFRLHSELIPYIPVNAHAPDLVARALAEGRRTFLLPEPWNATDPVVGELIRRFHAREVARYDFLWGNLPVYELNAR